MLAGYLADMLCGYLISIVIETPVLFALLSSVHSWRRRLFAGIWLTACTYPFLWLVLPAFIDEDRQRGLYLLVGEGVVWAAECLLFYFAFDWRRGYRRAFVLRDMAAVALANAASFGLGELWYYFNP